MFFPGYILLIVDLVSYDFENNSFHKIATIIRNVLW